ncbi:MAG: single-stranded-DNA-specific exonuclease RecJ [Oscillospiraceae bacterium]|nr:single-stranded-DNA-specific exonuclease RecJ [Oscillospiraceae bacterium]
MRYRNWEIGGFDRNVAVDLYKKEGLNPLLSVLLSSRGIADIKEARILLGQSAFDFHDPFHMTDMDKAVARINFALENNEKITIYGDYDVDGMTSCALLASWLNTKAADFDIYIPKRICEGYGLNSAALDELKSRGTELVITVDCGVTAVEEAQYAKKLDLGLVITDHHECKSELPQADAVVDPKRPDCNYPNDALAGVGVVFKLICALESQRPINEMLARYSDFVAIGTVADVMPVTEENRELIRYGLRVLNSSPRPGINLLLREALPEKTKVVTNTIGFTIAPRLNAAGRMGQPELSVELLMTDDDDMAQNLASQLEGLNTERRRLEAETYDEVSTMLSESLSTDPIILAKRGWHQGIAGIVAAKTSELHQLPSIIICIDDDGMGRGSCRSFGNFAIYDALKFCEDLLVSYGGHQMAAGVTLLEENINELRKRFTKYYWDNTELGYEPKLDIDFEVEKPELLAIPNVESIELLEPYGNGNPFPCLCIKSASLQSILSIGAGKHTRLSIEKSGVSMDCIYFSMPAENLNVNVGMLVDIAFEPQINEFRGRTTVQLHILDIKQSDPTPVSF